MRQINLAVFLVALVAGLALGAASAAEPTLWFAAVGALALAICLVPLLAQPDLEPCSIWHLTVLPLGLGLTLRGAVLSAGILDPAEMDRMFLLGRSPEFFFWPGVVILLALIFLVTGYLLPQGRWRSRPPPRRPVRIRRLYALALGALLVSTVATIGYVRNTLGSGPVEISAKRTVVADLGDREDHRSFGYLRLLASLAFFAHLLVLQDCVERRGRSLPARLLLGLTLLAVACLLPFYASSRTPIAEYILGSSALLYFARRRVPSYAIPSLLGVALILVLMIGALRMRRWVDEDETNIGLRSVLTLVTSRHYAGLCKTAHVMDAVPERLEPRWGQTIWIWVVAPIPRELWPSKPFVGGIGREVGEEVYGESRNGVAPGFFGEMYLNFFLPGVFLGSFVLGILLRGAWEFWRPRPGGDPFAVAVYVAGPMWLGFQCISQSPGKGMILVGLDLVVILAFLWMARGEAPALAAPVVAP